MYVFDSSEVLWILILGFIFGFFLAFGVGANDVANSFGTSVGSKVLTLRQACILATIFEILGAVLLGHKVSNTVRKEIFDLQMYSGAEKVLMLGFLSALIGSGIWNIVATFFRWPVSGTHSIIGAVVGFSIIATGFYGIMWKKIGKIVASWFVSPVLSGLISTSIFYIVKTFILTKENPLERGYMSLPFFWGFTIFINTFSVVHKGPDYLGFNLIPWWGVLILSIGLGLIVGLCVWFCWVPHLQHVIANMGDSENSENQIGKVDSTSKFPYPESENPGFEEKTLEIPMSSILINGGTSEPVSCDNSATIFTVEDDPKKSEEKEVLPDGAIPQDNAETAKIFSSLQILTAVFGSFAHGANDVSNAIGPVIAIWLIYEYGDVTQSHEAPFWIMLYGGVGISIGLWVWGQKVIKTIGEDLTQITPSSGFCIEIGAAATVLFASKIGIPISTTHCKVGSVVFVGWARSRAAVDWKLFRNIVLAWVLTLPISAILSAVTMAIFMAATTS